MKKLIISFMSVFMILFIAGFNISQAASLNVSASNTKPKIGDTVTVTVRFSQPVTTASFKLNYNNSVLQHSSNTIGGTNSGSSIVVDYIDLAGLKAVSSAKFTFKAKAAGTSKISISGITISDAQGNELSARPGSTTITVTKKETASSGNNSNSGSNKNNSNSNKTEEQPTFKNTNQKMYAKNDVTVRSSYSTSSTKLGTLKKGTTITRTGVGSNGWDKVTYNGKTAYVLSSYLTTTKPTENNNDEKNVITNSEVKNKANIIENSEINDIINNVEEIQTNNIEDSQLSNNIINSEVDNNSVEERFNNVIYIIIALIIIIAIAVIIKGKRK